ncbi:23S rRNA (guanine(745)-N(1))-methyltransferase [Aliivibrio kagoshimensis]|uniref:23S rRNA (guanine(745)-N(1))-methyltransferase n=1 Tax=Aliivibrio kagoshimensis TaxID=2910230 RepID=UPI003D12708F
MSYLCPLCHQPLASNNNQLRCDNNHQFDVAKEGYVNLMPAHHKRSKSPGDNKEMMQARRQFLAANHYQPMQQAVARLCKNHIADNATAILDIGCGEGYYTAEIANQFTDHDTLHIFGLDISKVAIKYAAKRYRHCQFSVASSHKLPFADESLDAIVRIYAPCKDQELQRTLKPTGKVITVTPASRHLYQLRDAVYQEVRLHPEEPEVIDGFQLELEEKLSYRMDLTGEEALALLQMTPFAWKATQEYKEALQSMPTFNCEADFMIRVYNKSIGIDSHLD